MGATALRDVKGTSAEDSRYEERCQLAAAFRWAARLNMHEGIANHFSLSVSEDGTQFLMNPCVRHWTRMRASDLILVDASDPKTLEGPNAPDPTAWGLHGAMHRNLPHARCALHVHPKYGTVIASLKDSNIPPIDQNTMRFYQRLAIDDNYGGLAFEEEAERVCGLMGNKSIMMMGNHGVMVTAPNVAQAFDELYYLERACETLVTAYSTQKELRIAPHEVAARTCEQWQGYPAEFAHSHFSELMGILDEEEPDYRD